MSDTADRRPHVGSAARRRLARAPDDRHDPHAVDGRGAEGQFGPSRHADGAGAGRLHAVVAIPALRSRQARLAQPRPLRAVGRPCVDAALFAAPPRRRRGDRRATASKTGKPAVSLDDIEQFRQLGVEDAGPPRISPHHRRRDDDRAARRRAAAIRSAWRSPSAGSRRATTSPASRCSTTTSTRSAATAT